jgi:hypothetical protein
LVQGDEGPAQVVRLGHRGTPSLDAATKLPFPRRPPDSISGSHLARVPLFSGRGGLIGYLNSRSKEQRFSREPRMGSPAAEAEFAGLAGGGEWFRTFSSALGRQRFCGFVRVGPDLPAHRSSEQ